MFDTDNRLLAMIKQSQIPLGMQCFTGDRAMIEVLGLTGFDFVMLDTEHSPANPRAIEDAVLAADIVGLVPLVRVPSCADETAIRRAMEAGAQGLFVPEVKSADDVRRVLDAALFPPLGSRGICPATRAARYSYRSFVDYAEWNNRNFLVVPLIENPDAVDNIEEICALDQVHVLAFGPGDLAYAIGEGNNMTDSPKIREAYLKVQAAADRHGVAVMGGPVLDPSVDGCKSALEDGVKVFCLGLDVMGFRRFCEHTVRIAGDSLQGTAYTRPETRPQTSLRISLGEKPTTTIERNRAMTTHVNRFVVGPDSEGRSTVLQRGLTNVQSREGFYWRATLWATQETPVDNSIDGDRSQTDGLGASREPFPNGMICRALEIPPDDPDAAEHRRVLADLNQEVHQKHQPSQTDLARHPSMHRTDTLDCLTCVRGEIFLVTDRDEVPMRPGDTVIIRGTNHASSNRSNAPCLLVGTMIDAAPPNGG